MTDPHNCMSADEFPLFSGGLTCWTIRRESSMSEFVQLFGRKGPRSGLHKKEKMVFILAFPGDTL